MRKRLSFADLLKMYSAVTFFVLLLPCGIIAQKTVPLKEKSQTVDTASVIYTDSIEEKLVELALNGPAIKSSQSQSKINEYQLRATKNTWVNLFTFNTNYNNQTFTQGSQNGSVFFPGLTFGFTIPLGTILSTGVRVKAAKQQVAISEFTQEQLVRNIRAEVIGKYRQYLSYGLLISIQNQTVDDEETAYLQAKEQFRNGVIKIEDYNTAQKLYNIELTKKINLQLERDLLKLEIERIIGTGLDGVIKGTTPEK